MQVSQFEWEVFSNSLVFFSALLDLPLGNSIKERIDRSGLHPITSLTGITLAEKKALLDMDVILCSDLVKTPQLLSKVGLTTRRMNRVLRETTQLCAH